MRAPRVCFVAPNIYPILAQRTDIEGVGGAEVQQAFVARMLVRQGFEVAMVCEDFGQPDEDVIGGMRIHKTFSADAGLPALRAVHPRMTKLWAALARADADIYYVRCAAMTMGLVAAFCRVRGRRSIFAAASDLDFAPGHELISAPWYRAMFRWGLRRADAVIAQSQAQVDLLRNNYQLDADLIRSMFVSPHQAAGQEYKQEILWCGVLRRAKRVEQFIELARRIPERVFRVVGGPDGSSYSQGVAAQLHALCESMPNLRFDGFLPYESADARFDQARVFINTSLSEGFPNTFLQAWSRGTPTLSFVDVGAQHGAIAAGKVCASLEEMESYLRDWCGNDASWQVHSAAARRYFELNHSVDATSRAYTGLLNRLGFTAPSALCESN